MRRGTPPAKLFGKCLILLREEKGMSQRVAASLIDSPASTVSQIELGYRALKNNRLGAWSVMLGVGLGDLEVLWLLCQGLLSRADGAFEFYEDVFKENPRYRLASFIATSIVKLAPMVDLEVIQEGSNIVISSTRFSIRKKWYEIEVPEIGRDYPIVRNRGKSVKLGDLEAAMLELTGPERSQVLGYIQALIEFREED